MCGIEGLLPYVWMKWIVLPEENTPVCWDGGIEFVGTSQTSVTADRHTGYLLHKTQRVSKRDSGAIPNISTKSFPTFD